MNMELITMNNIDIDIFNNLSSTEKQLIDIILRIIKTRTPSTTVRICGGWVRDRLLDTPSDDIDLMVDNMSGEKFAEIMAEEMGLKGPAVIEANPEKTKNIETATMRIPVDGVEVELDFAQCRKEEYGDNRREVIVTPATAEEDAFRRDLTIGAIFYNINEKKVEDFTGKGIKDLITGTIRTPYDSGESDPQSVEEAKKSFIEDPLRVFRAVRFASKYNGDISPATLAAMTDPEVIDAIFYSERKIATDRIGKELKKMMGNENPAIGFKILKDTGLWQIILDESIKGSKYEGKMENLDMEQNNAHHELSLWGHTYRVLENLLEHFNPEDPEKRIIMIMAALTHDLGKLYTEVHGESSSVPGSTSYHGHEKESKELSELLLKFLRFENNTIKQVSNLARYHMQPHNLGRGEGGMSAMRKFIRRMGENSLNWLDVFNLSVADAYSKGLELSPDVVTQYEGFRAKMEEALATMRIQEEKVAPILNGHQIMSTLAVTPGKHMSVVTEYLKNLVDEYPEMTPEEATTRLNDVKASAEAMMAQQPELKYEEAIVNVLQNQTVASGSTLKIVSSTTACPQHLFQKTHGDITRLIKEDKHHEAIAHIKTLQKEYGDDDRVARVVAISMFNILAKDPKLRDNDLLQYALDKTEHSLYDPVLTSYATGLLLILKTVTEPEAILQIGSDVAKMNPGILRGVLDALPQKVYHEDIRTQLKTAINENI